MALPPEQETPAKAPKTALGAFERGVAPLTPTTTNQAAADLLEKAGS